MQNRKTNNFLFKVIFYSVLCILILYGIWPYTRFYHFEPVYTNYKYQLNYSQLTMRSGERKKLYLYFYKKKLTFSSTDFKVAWVSPYGTIYARKKGTAVIRVKVDGKVLKCKVTVR